MSRIVLRVKRGVISTLYTDAIDLRAFGPLRVKRTSNVEFDEKKDGWVVEFIDGTRLPDTYRSREEALQAEVDFLQGELSHA